MRLFGLRLDKAWARAQYGSAFERTMWPTITAFELIGALEEDDTCWRLTDRGMYDWVLMMSAFFESVNDYRDAMRAHVRQDQHETDTLCVPAADWAGVAK